MHAVYLLTVCTIVAANAAEKEESTSFASSIVADVGPLMIAVGAGALLFIGFCVFVSVMRYRQGDGSDELIGPVSVTEI